MGLLDSDLPARLGWGRVRDAYEITKKPRNLDVHLYGNIPFAAMEAIPQGGQYAPVFTPKPPGELTSGTYFERGDVLVAKITPSFENGKQALVQQLPTPFGYATTEVVPLRAKGPGHDHRFLFFYLLHPDVRHYTAERMEGTTARQRVPDDVFLDLPLPRFNEQEQSAISDACELLHKGLALCDKHESVLGRLKGAAIREIFTRGLRGDSQKETEIGLIPAGWSVVRLGSLGRIGNGSTPKKGVREYWDGGTFPWLTSAKVYDRNIVAADAHVTPIALKECHLPVLKPGAVLVAITGQGKTLGHCAVLRMEATINQHLAYLQPDLGHTNPRYVAGYLETQYENLRQVASGGGSTKGALTCAYLRDLQIPMPPTKDEQDEIAEVIDAIDRKTVAHRRKRVVLEELFTSLLNKLMTGEVRVADLDLSALLSTEEARS
ncbi:MAG: restriction endonuclease subunit S [Phycisphaerales bacterium]|nr:restriction endonuclease subunit S [Phycisphaerales bacterium]